MTLYEIVYTAILNEIALCGGNKSHAAKNLDISVRTVRIWASGKGNPKKKSKQMDPNSDVLDRTETKVIK